MTTTTNVDSITLIFHPKYSIHKTKLKATKKIKMKKFNHLKHFK